MIPRWHLRRLWTWRPGHWALLLCLALLAGCRSWNWLGPGFSEQPDLGPWANAQRDSNKAGEQAGLSNKAREIERSLGVR